MSKLTITEFLEARIAENERAVVVAREYATNQMFGNASAPSISIGDSDGTKLWSTDQLLAECAAKREIIEQRNRSDKSMSMDDWSMGWSDGNYAALYALAAIYKDHPDYQKEWAL